MVKRLLDCSTSDILNMDKAAILKSIASSEGRVLMAEVIGCVQPLLYGISNAELACAFGADILLLNMFDVFDPMFNGIPQVEKSSIIREIKRLTGRIVAINLEPVDDSLKTMGFIRSISRGRLASPETASMAYNMGVDMIVLTGNPETGVSNRAITSALLSIREKLKDKLILVAGKMHSAGSSTEMGEHIITRDDIKDFVGAGSDIILLSAPGTVPGITLEYIHDLVSFAHSLGVLTITAVGTSQEGSDTDTIKRIALMCKMTGTDIHHIGDAGYPGIAVPENIMDYSITIRGRRHTFSRMARSVMR